MPMKTIEGYSKEKYTNTSVLLAGGGAKALSDFIGSLSWDSTNKKIKYTPVEGSAIDLVTLSWDNIANKPTSLPANGGNADTVDGYHIEDLDFRYARTGWSFASPGDSSMTGSTDLQDWVTNMYNQGGYKGYSSITVGSWWWVRSLDFSSPAGTIRTSGAMIVYSGDGSNNKNYKHFLVLDAYAELYGITSNEESWKYYSRFLNNRNYTDFVYSKSTSDNRYLRKDTNDSTSYQYSFTKTDDHAIQVGTIRGTAVGSQTGDFIHLYERVAIGSPSGWGSRNAPSYGLSTYGGAWLATDTGNVGIGTDSPEAKLEVTGNGKFTNSLSVNTGNNFNFYTDTNLFFVNKSLENWRALDYEYWVYLLIPVITTTNTSAMNFIEGTFNFWKTGANVYDNVHVNLNCVYNVLEYSLMSYGQGTDWKLVRCTYNGVDYYALQGYYHANPYTHTNFCGHVNSTYRGGNNTTDKPLNLPYGVCYYYAPGGNNQILNSEVYNSISTTLTTSVITEVNRRGLSNPGGFIGPLIGNATTATYASSAGSVTWSNVTGKPFNWSGQSGQPTWLWGSNDGTNYYVWDPSNFSVNYADSAGSAGSVTVNSSDSNCTYRMVWHSGNTLYGTDGIYCNPYTDYLYATSMNTSDWFRSSGSTGWYNESYGGGIYMSDSTYVRVYNDKRFYNSNSSQYAFYTPGGITVGSHLWGTSAASTWIDGQRYDRAVINVTNSTDANSFWPLIRWTSSSQGRWDTIGVLGNNLYFMSSATSKTDNGYDTAAYFDMTTSRLYSNGLYHTSYGSSEYVLTSDGGAARISSMSVNYANSAGDADTSNRAKFLETFHQNSTTNTHGSQYPIWAQWSDSTNVRLKCTNYTVWTDKADNANYANSAGSAGSAASSTYARYLTCPDTRSSAPAPGDYTATSTGVSFDFKESSVTGLSGYSGVMTFRPYSSAQDWTGGEVHQIAFLAGGGLYHRIGTSSWGSWERILTSSNWSSYISIPSVGNDTNYYPIRSYTSGLQISSYSGSTDCALFVPYAASNQAGVVSTEAQIFSGQKTFSSIRLSTTNFGGYLYFGDDSYAYLAELADDQLTLNATKIFLGISGSQKYYIDDTVFRPVTANSTSSSGIALGSSDYRFTCGYFSDKVYAYKGFYESSDERLKNILNPVKVNLDDLSKLRKVYYLWKDRTEDEIQLGMIAQDVQKLYPELVSVDKETGYLSLAYDKLSVLALEAIDVLYKEHKKLKKHVDELEKLLINNKIY